jgi:hypothetical protein
MVPGVDGVEPDLGGRKPVPEPAVKGTTSQKMMQKMKEIG